MIEIIHRYTNAVVYESDTADTIAAAVIEAVKREANLSGAYLSGANLSGADLGGAYLSGAKGIKPEFITPLLMLRDQPGPIRLYKLVTAEGAGPFNGGIKYEVGQEYSVENANTDVGVLCGSGINVATMDWCLREWREGYRILVVECTAADIACIPTATDGKIRLHRCKVVGEKDLTGLVTEAAAKEGAA